jgi:hypothetical protein
MDVILISGHSGVLDQPRLYLNDRTYVVTYGKVGECSLTGEFVNLEGAFFGNRLPINVDHFKEIMPSLTIVPDKTFKLHETKYHDMSLTLCTYGFVDADGEECSEEASSYARVYLSGVFLMGKPPSPYYNNQYISIRPIVHLNGTKIYMIPRYVASQIYKNSLFPNSKMLDKMFLKSQKNGKIINRKSIPLKELISKTRTTLSEIINIFKSVVPTIFLVEGCREYRGVNLEDRLASSSDSESASPVVDGVPLQLVASQQPLPLTQTAFKSHRVKGSRTKDKFDSLLLTKGSKTKGPRSKGKVESLVSMPLSNNVNAGKKTRKKRKNKRK